MRIQKVEAQCPVCRDWQRIPEELLGWSTTCANCRQTVTMVPRSSQARQWRGLGMTLVAVIGGLMICWMVAAYLATHR